MLATIPVAGPLLLHPPDDSGLDPVAITYEFVAAPPATGGGSGGGAGPGSGGTGGTSGGSGSGATTNTTNVILPGAGVGASGGGASAGGPGSPVRARLGTLARRAATRPLAASIAGGPRRPPGAARHVEYHHIRQLRMFRVVGEGDRSASATIAADAAALAPLGYAPLHASSWSP